MMVSLVERRVPMYSSSSTTWMYRIIFLREFLASSRYFCTRTFSVIDSVSRFTCLREERESAYEHRSTCDQDGEEWAR